MELKKAKKRAALLFAASILVLLYVSYLTLSSAIPMVRMLLRGESLVSVGMMIMSIFLYIVMLLTVIFAVQMLGSLRKTETPFCEVNVRRLLRMGWLLTAFEPVNAVVQRLCLRLFPLKLPDGIAVTTTVSYGGYGGIFLLTGLVLLTTAAVFRYGIELQRLSDETL